MRRRIFIKYKRLEESNLKFIKIKEWKYIKRYRLKKLKKHSKTLKFKKEHNKVYKENINSSNFLLFEGSNSILASGPNAIGINRENGVFVNGPVSFSSSVDNVKFAGTFRINPIAASGLPSTMVTPIPMFIIEPPIAGIRNMTAAASVLAGLA